MSGEDKMIITTEKDLCCGCGACAQICTQSCIQMKPDEEGFIYPAIDKAKCVQCGICKQVCPISHARERNQSVQEAYIAYTNNESVRLASSSGGVFSAIAEEILHQNGVVFGAAFDQKWLTYHIGIEDSEKLRLFRGSKYLQSRKERTYLEAKEVLDQGKKVLFSGTGCEIAGLKGFLRNDYHNLFTIDILCHGVPSPLLWRKYLDEKEIEYGAIVQRINFRNKKYGWKKYALSLEFSNDMVYEKSNNEDIFMQMFLRNICLRPSCYNCKFRPIYSQADISLGDCWGIEKYKPELNDNKGLSLVLVHTEKGKELLEGVYDELIIEDADLEKISQSVIYNSVEAHPHRKRFFSSLSEGKSINQLYKLLQISRVEKAILKIKRLQGTL